jgi:hypothetical protein
MPLQDLELPLQSVRGPQVIGIEEREILAAGEAEAMIAGCGGAGVGLPHVAHPLPVGGHPRGRVVPGAVVDDEDLVGRATLGQGALHRLNQQRAAVVGGDDDADRGHWRANAGDQPTRTAATVCSPTIS